ncbi:transketolase [Mesorhizobium sp. CGMCC 1.15528]|uniref:Pyruvate dehydrogenase E1 component n=1 Tax=Mesorhizobium zhangyense TaxID=1776730 RepID=A0A7C9VGN1_9HYPH|nr:1-deoxy-D-xylulose-5-phosphate synthase N-terminal domain-containing protein [Mesorhizobium zhangyense]NGN44572.1 transketolase [Mesorhizobium zhangyense]
MTALRKFDTTNHSGEERASLIETLRELEKRALWLSTWMIHNANAIRPSRDGLKVGGHQSSSASLVTLMTALYFHTLRPEDRVAVKPHASPVFHAIQYLLGRQSRDQLINFRGLGGAQSYPSRTKDSVDVDFSTGSVGLGVAATLFASLAQDLVMGRDMMSAGRRPGRMIALMGDAELDEGNIFEAVLEGWKHDVRNLWWIVDYNRQSLDGVINDQLAPKFLNLFENFGWRTVTLKYGKKLEAARHGPSGEALLDWIDRCPNQLYSALSFKGGGAWRERLKIDLSGASGLGALLDAHDDNALGELMCNLGGHDLATILDAFDASADEQPTLFLAYTIKGHRLPLAGHKDNHAGQLTATQVEAFRATSDVRAGREWEPFEGIAIPQRRLQAFLENVPFAARKSERSAPAVGVPPIAVPDGREMSTQEAFGKIMTTLGREGGALADRIVTTSPDVTVSTNLSGWVNRRGLFNRFQNADIFQVEKVPSVQKWQGKPSGQHMELGIAENNLFLMLSQLGLSHDFFGTRLLPVGTVYDPFINRGLDALIYACYQDSRFMLTATPSGITLAPEGGAHQSVNTPLIGMAQDGLTYFEPAFADELATIMEWGFGYMQDEEGGSVYLRLSTRALEQPQRQLSEADRRDIVNGAYWLRRPDPGANLAIAYCGAIAPEAIHAVSAFAGRSPGPGILAITSPDHLYRGWDEACRRRRQGEADVTSHIETLLEALPRDAGIVTMQDGHPTALAWLGSVQRNPVHALGVNRFGQCGDLTDLYRIYGLDADAVEDAARELAARR